MADRRNLDGIIDMFLGRLALEIQKEVIFNMLPMKGYDTGRLRNSIAVLKDGNKWLVGTNLEYAIYLEIGTGIHGPKKRPIRPKKAQALHWYDRVLGKEMFAKSVKGIKPRWMFHRAVHNVEKLARKVIKDMSQ